MSTDTPRTTERLHLLENEHDDVAFESLADFARQLERELAEAKAVIEQFKRRVPEIQAEMADHKQLRAEAEYKLAAERARVAELERERDEAVEAFRILKKDSGLDSFRSALDDEKKRHWETSGKLGMVESALAQAEAALREIKDLDMPYEAEAIASEALSALAEQKGQP